MVEIQIRSADLTGIMFGRSLSRRREVEDLYSESFRDAPSSDLRHGAVLVEHEFETEAEANSRRLKFLFDLAAHDERLSSFCDSGESFMEALDRLRNAPKPRVTVLDGREK